MNISEEMIGVMIAKEEIRELALLYCRGVDRKDYDLLRTLYTRDGTDSHGRHFNGPANEYVDFLEKSLVPACAIAHYVCNHLVEVHGEEAEGEVYALGYLHVLDGKGGMREVLDGVRYLDRYRKEDGRWRFASRNVMFDLEYGHPIESPAPASVPNALEDPSYKILSSRLFARGPRA